MFLTAPEHCRARDDGSELKALNDAVTDAMHRMGGDGEQDLAVAEGMMRPSAHASAVTER